MFGKKKQDTYVCENKDLEKLKCDAEDLLFSLKAMVGDCCFKAGYVSEDSLTVKVYKIYMNLMRMIDKETMSVKYHTLRTHYEVIEDGETQIYPYPSFENKGLRVVKSHVLETGTLILDFVENLGSVTVESTGKYPAGEWYKVTREKDKIYKLTEEEKEVLLRCKLWFKQYGVDLDWSNK